MRHREIGLAAVAVVVSVGCGEPLTGAEYRGAPIFKLEGQITTPMPLSEDLQNADFAVSIFWVPNEALAQPMLREQSSVTTTVRFPATFELRVFEPPNDEHFDSADAAWVVGLVLVYVDSDNDGRLGRMSEDIVVGGSLGRGLLYAREALDAQASPTLEALPAGFSVIDLPLGPTCNMLPHRDASGRFSPLGDFSCNGGCRTGFRCDERERVCVPNETFILVINEGLGLGSVICRN